MVLIKHKKQTLPLKKQIELINKSVDMGEHFGEVLNFYGYTYNDLRYVRGYQKIPDGRVPLELGSFTNNSGIPLVSFFSGAGGLDLGFEAAGFKHVAAFEHNEIFCKTLRMNRPEWNVFGPPYHPGDMSDIDSINSSLSKIVSTPFDGVFIGGPPCQPFSIAANQRFAKSGENFKRVGFSHEKMGNLLFSYVELIKAFKPRAFLIENVPGLRDIDDGIQLNFAISDLTKNGYNIAEPTVLNAANYGVAQNRNRIFIIGSRSRTRYTFPMPNNENIGVINALSGIKSDARNNEIRDHKAESILRYMKLQCGQRDQLGRVDRLDPYLPSKTVIAGGMSGGGRSHLHPEIPRTLSVRECARIQTFPDDYIFYGPIARQFTQVGNAVPPVLSAQIAALVRDIFF